MSIDGYEDAARALDDRCFRALAEMDFTNELRSSIAFSVGYLVLDVNPFCMAFYVSQSTLMTARHCFYDKETNTKNEFYKRLASVTFRALNSMIDPVNINLLRSIRPDDDLWTERPIPHYRDAVLLDLKLQTKPERFQLNFDRRMGAKGYR